jgi:antigen flippase
MAAEPRPLESPTGSAGAIAFEGSGSEAPRAVSVDKPIARDVLLSLTSRGAIIVAGIVSSIVTARTLGPVGRGAYFYVITLAGMATQFGNLGLPSSNVYSLARNEALLPKLAGNAFWISLVVGGAAAAATLLVDAVSGSPRVSATWFVLLIVPPTLYGLLGSNLLVGLSRIRDYNLFQLGSTGLQLILVVVAGLLHPSVAVFLGISALTGTVGAAWLLVILRRLGRISWQFHWTLVRQNVRYAAKAYSATVLGYAVSRAGVFLLRSFADKSQLGIYSVAVQFSDVLIIVPATVSMVLFPELLRSGAAGRFSRTTRAATYVGLAMTILSLCTGVVATFVVPLLFGRAFAPASTVLWVMLPGVLALSVANIMSQYLATHGIPIANVWAWAAALLLFLAAGSLAIPRFGAMGAGLSLSVSYFFLAIALASLALKHSNAQAAG